MKTYRKLEDGAHSLDGGPDYLPSRFNNKIEAEVLAGKAVVIPYVKPELTTEQLIADLETTITARNIRSAWLGDQFAIDKIQDVESQIALLR